jgi:hypothetical protein
MTVRNPSAFLTGIWDWSILSDCFGGSGIEPTDLDGLVERRGRFLVLETKRPGADIPPGQQYTFEALQRTGLFTVVVLWGTTNSPEEAQLYTPRGVSGVFPCDLALLRQIVATWYAQVDGGQPVALSPVVIEAFA